MEKPKKEVKEDMSKIIEVEAAELLSKIERIVKGEKLELALVDDIEKTYNKIKSDADSLGMDLIKASNEVSGISSKAKEILKQIDSTDGDVKKLEAGAKDLGITLPAEAEISIRQLKVYKSSLSQLASKSAKVADSLFSMLG
jgi:Zn-dependent metalloprotease